MALDLIRMKGWLEGVDEKYRDSLPAVAGSARFWADQIAEEMNTPETSKKKSTKADAKEASTD